MLPPRLNSIKKMITAKNLILRTKEEKELLKELDDLSKNMELKEFFEKDFVSGITAGPPELCPCCGRRS